MCKCNTDENSHIHSLSLCASLRLLPRRHHLQEKSTKKKKRFSGISHIDADGTENTTRVNFIIDFRIPTSVHMNRRRLLLSATLLSYFLLHGTALASGDVKLRDNLDLAKTTTLSSSSHRKMLRLSPEKAERKAEPERIGEKCKSTDIVVNQAASEPMPNGIPSYTVEITNQCMSGCKISRIHISCGWFSSAKLINPRVFKRIHYDDCLVNNGKPLPFGSTLSFHYANTFPYPLSVAFVTCS